MRGERWWESWFVVPPMHAGKATLWSVTRLSERTTAGEMAGILKTDGSSFGMDEQREYNLASARRSQFLIGMFQQREEIDWSTA